MIEGYRNLLIPPSRLKEQILKEAEDRLNICKDCPYNSAGQGNVPKNVSYCKSCGCNLKAKTACLSCECPEKKWKAVLSKYQEDKIKQKLREENDST